MTGSHTFAPAELRVQHQEDRIAERLAPELGSRTALHFGAKNLFLVAGLVSRGVDAVVLPVQEPSAEVVASLGLDGRVLAGPLTDPIERRFDVALSFGGFDGLERLSLDQAIRHLTRAADLLVLTYDGGHLPAELRRLGFSRDFAADVSGLPEGSVLFRNEPVTDIALVQAYETALRDAAAAALIDSEARDDRHREMVAELRQQLLTARDAAIGAELAAGEARAREVEVTRQLDALQNEAGRRRLELADGIDRLVPDRAWSWLGALRRSIGRAG